MSSRENINIDKLVNITVRYLNARNIRNLPNEKSELAHSCWGEQRLLVFM